MSKDDFLIKFTKEKLVPESGKASIRGEEVETKRGKDLAYFISATYTQYTQ